MEEVQPTEEKKKILKSQRNKHRVLSKLSLNVTTTKKTYSTENIFQLLL